MQEKSSWTDTQFNPNKLVNVRWYIIKSNHLRDAEKDNIKEKVVVDIQQNESVELEMNAINNETNKTLKQSNNHWMKTPAIENEYNKLEKRKPQIENTDYTEDKIKINEMKQNIIKKLSKLTNIDKISIIKENKWQNNQMLIKVENYAIEDLLHDFKLNLTLLNEIIYLTASMIRPVTITHKQNSFKQPKWKLRIQKSRNIEEKYPYLMK